MKRRILTVIALSCIVGLASVAKPAPAQAKSNWFGWFHHSFGGYQVGPVRPAVGLRPWLFGDNPMPPAGCRTIHYWSTGHALLLGYTAYRFHLEVTFCWDSRSWVEPGFLNVKGRHFTKIKRKYWWSDQKGVDLSDIDTQLVTTRFACTLETGERGMCASVKLTGELTHIAVPAVHAFGITVHPWVKIVFRDDGTVSPLGGHDYSPG